MTIPVELETNSSLQIFQNRYILTQVGHQQIGFPSRWVAEIMLIERSQILNLPFYDSKLLGVVHHQSHIIPLVTLHFAYSVSQQPKITEMLTAIRLSQSVSELMGVGVIVDRVIGSITHEQLLAKKDNAAVSSHSPIELFQPEKIPPSIWQPR